MAAPASDFDVLRKRVQRFLKGRDESQREIHQLIRHLQTVGKVGVFGGMLRDLAIFGNAGFRGDIDVVVDTENIAELDRHLSARDSELNRFGGHRIDFGRWRVDVWALSRTWAFEKRLVRGSTLSDLVTTTFFNWDAVVFHPEDGQFTATRDYLTAVKDRLLDINLEPSPYPLKSCVRALRFLFKYEARFTPRLTKYVLEVLTETEDGVLQRAEREGHQVSVLSSIDLSHLRDQLRSHTTQTGTSLFSSSTKQLDLGLGSE